MLAIRNRLLTGSLRPEGLARLAVPANILLVILLAHGLARLSWSLIPTPPQAPPSISDSARQPVATPNAVDADYTTIASWHLFGQVTTAKPAPPPVVKAPETKLNLKLAGIFYAEGGGKALALIGGDSGDELSYAVGDQLPGGARLEQILRNQVVLSRNGRLETLSLPREDGGGIQGVTTSPLPLPQDDAELATEEEAAVDASELANRFRNTVMTDPTVLQELAFASPYVQNGQFMGFRLRPGRDQQLLGELDLQNGDVITEINGTPLNSPAQSFALLQELLEADTVNIKVLRNGTEIPYTFYLND